MLEHHGVFQGYYFFHHLGLDRDMREQFRGRPDFGYTARCSDRRDQNAFDPEVRHHAVGSVHTDGGARDVGAEALDPICGRAQA